MEISGWILKIIIMYHNYIDQAKSNLLKNLDHVYDFLSEF